MKKHSHHEQIDRNDRSSATGERHMTSGSPLVAHIPESIAEALGTANSLVERGGYVSLEELQGAVEYLLDTVKEAQARQARLEPVRLNASLLCHAAQSHYRSVSIKDRRLLLRIATLLLAILLSLAAWDGVVHFAMRLIKLYGNDFAPIAIAMRR
jgi:hypothetical protein